MPLAPWQEAQRLVRGGGLAACAAGTAAMASRMAAASAIRRGIQRALRISVLRGFPMIEFNRPEKAIGLFGYQGLSLEGAGGRDARHEAVQLVGLRRRLVGPDAADAGEAQGDPGFV